METEKLIITPISENHELSETLCSCGETATHLVGDKKIPVCTKQICMLPALDKA